MKLFIEAATIRTGGGLTYLYALLEHADPRDYGFEEVHVFTPTETAERLPRKPWLVMRHTVHLDEGVAPRMYWLRLVFPGILRRERPAALLLTTAAPVRYARTVSVCQNLLPFEGRERFRYPWKDRQRLHLLRRSQMNSFLHATRVIHMTEYARNVLLELEPGLKAKSVVIPHGVDDAFRNNRRGYRIPGDRPVRLLYVSIIDVYKHQDKVVEALHLLEQAGIQAELTLAGPAYGPAMEKVRQAIVRYNLEGRVHFAGPGTQEDLVRLYEAADLFVFASSCETFGIILLEAMAQALPIACSLSSSLPETLSDAGEYFDPLQPASVAHAVMRLIEDESLRQKLGEAAARRAADYSWNRTAADTYEVLRRTATEI